MIKIEIPLEIEILMVIARYGSIKGVISLHNIAYEMKKKGILKSDIAFIKYSFGYYSKELEEAINTLKRLGLIKVSKSNDGYEVYEVSSEGLKLLKSVEEISKQATQ